MTVASPVHAQAQVAASKQFPYGISQPMTPTQPAQLDAISTQRMQSNVPDSGTIYVGNVQSNATTDSERTNFVVDSNAAKSIRVLSMTSTQSQGVNSTSSTMSHVALPVRNPAQVSHHPNINYGTQTFTTAHGVQSDSVYSFRTQTASLPSISTPVQQVDASTSGNSVKTFFRVNCKQSLHL